MGKLAGANNRAAPSGAGAGKRKSGSADSGSIDHRAEARADAKQDKKQPQDRNKRTKGKGGGGDAGSWKQRFGGMFFLVFMMGAGFASFVATIWGFMAGNGITVLDIDDMPRVKEVLFGGEPWLIYCVDNKTMDYPLPKVLEDNAGSLHSSIGVKTGVLDCFKTLESGRNIAQKFGFGSHKAPFSFATANGDKPRLVNIVGVRSSDEMVKKLKPILTVAAEKIDTIKKFGPKCSSRRACVIIGHKTQAARDTAMNVFKPLLTRHRGVRVVTVDTSFWGLKIGNAIMETRPQKGPNDKAADVLCLARTEGNIDKGPNETHVGTFLQDLDSSSASAFMKACVTQDNLVALGVEPKVAAKLRKQKKPTVIKAPPLPDDGKKQEKQESRPKVSNRKVDSVGSRAHLEQDDLFEAVGEDESDGEDSGDDESEDEDDGEEVQL